MASSGPKLDLEFLTKRKDNVEVPKRIETPMCFCGGNCKLVVDGVYSYYTSSGLASRQILRRSQGTLLPSSVNPRYRIRGTMCDARINLIKPGT
jgi:hypothetical protein